MGRLRERPTLAAPSRCREGASANFACKWFSEIRVRLLLRNPLIEKTDRHQAALKNTIADAPATTTIKTRIKMAGSSTTSSALPVVVACISRMPTVAR